MLGSKVIWHQKRGKSPVFRVWNQHFYNFPPSLWSEVQLTYIFVFSIIFWFLKVIGIGLHSRDFQTLKCCHSALFWIQILNCQNCNHCRQWLQFWQLRIWIQNNALWQHFRVWKSLEWSPIPITFKNQKIMEKTKI